MRIVAAAADLVLSVDPHGIIKAVTLGVAFDESEVRWTKLVGKLWRDTVTPESRIKVDQLLADARGNRPTRGREINQLDATGQNETPFRFTAAMLEDETRVVVVGRDLRPIAKAQQQLVTTQQAMDREYARLRQADTRYRVLFHVCAEGVLVVDGSTRRVIEANPSAATIIGEPPAVLHGKTVQELFEPASHEVVLGQFAAVEAGGRPVDVQAQLAGQVKGAPDVTVSTTMFRQAGSVILLVRIWRTGSSASSAGAGRFSRMIAAVDAMPDSFVVTSEDRRILCANNAFCELVQHASENHIVGESLDRWIGRPGVDLAIMTANLREHGTVRNFATIVRTDFGPPQEAVVTAVSALDGNFPCFGFTIRQVSSRIVAAPTSTIMPRSVEQLRELVGRVSLKELVRESADLIERLCIEAALDVSGNNRASAAQLLGLSRQGLYSKLRRHGLEEFDPT